MEEVKLKKTDWEDLLKQAESFIKKALIDLEQFNALRNLSQLKIEEFK